MRIPIGILLLLLAGATPAADRLAQLRDAMAHGRFIAYQPTSLRAIDGAFSEANPESIRADLQVLRPRFDSLITYDSIHGAEAIPAIARSLGFRAVIVGVWNPLNPAELDAALAAARDPIVVGVSLGNEALFFHRCSVTEMTRLLDSRRAPVPLAITEPFHMFAKPELQPVLQRLDFLLVNVHPVFQPWFHTAPQDTAVQFVINVTRDLNFHGPILVKETGLPSAPADKGFSLEKQAWFYTELERRLPVTGERAWAYFSAFDAPWRASEAPEEAHWGLYDEKRQPKPVVASIKPLTHESPRRP
jgi:exo-beta-1,3-glucanase (GH17 family)